MVRCGRVKIICSWWDSKPEAGFLLRYQCITSHMKCSVCAICNALHTIYTEKYIRPIHGILFACNFSLLWNRFACLTIVFFFFLLLFQIHFFLELFSSLFIFSFIVFVVVFFWENIYIFLSVILIGLYIWSHASNNYSR